MLMAIHGAGEFTPPPASTPVPSRGTMSYHQRRVRGMRAILLPLIGALLHFFSGRA